MHCHNQIAAAAKAALESVAELTSRVSTFRIAPPERERLPALSAYVERARNALDHHGENQIPVLKRDVDLMVIVWLKGTATVTAFDEAGRLQVLIEAAMAGSSALQALACDQLIYLQGSDFRLDPEGRDFAVLSMTYRLGVMTPMDDATIILT